METLWRKAKTSIKEQIPSNIYRLWIEPLDFLDAGDGSQVVLSCPNFFIKKRIQAHYESLINNELTRAAGRALTFCFKINGNGNGNGNGNAKDSAADTDHSEASQLLLPNIQVQPINGRRFRRDYTFNHFVVGRNSDLAYRAAFSLASKKMSEPNALFLLSKSGMGKSHLSQAVGHKILSAHPRERVYYMSAEDFTNDMVHSLRNNTIENFKRRYRENCDVLLLEEVHLLSGRTRTQTELALTLDYLLESGKKLIFSSCYAPSEIPKMSDHLVSRLSQSMLTVIETPDYATRFKILRRKAAERGVEIPTDVAEYMASELSDNVRQIESGLVSVVSRSCLMGVPIDLALAEDVVRNIIAQRKSITIDAITRLVGREYGVSVKDVVSRSRKQSIVRPRQIAIFLSRRHTSNSLAQIGKKFNRMHGTVIHAINSVEKEMKLKGEVYQQVGIIEKKLESGQF
ncbi:MAG: chromosomal replication initiator protein DnaA [Desulfosalsimonadaceae bacterium]